MRPVLLTALLIFALFCHIFALPAAAQIRQARTDEAAAGPIDPSTEELIAAGIGGFAGMGVAFLFLEAEILPVLELFGYTDRTVYPVFGLLAGSVATRLLYLSWRESLAQ